MSVSKKYKGASNVECHSTGVVSNDSPDQLSLSNKNRILSNNSSRMKSKSTDAYNKCLSDILSLCDIVDARVVNKNINRATAYELSGKKILDYFSPRVMKGDFIIFQRQNDFFARVILPDQKDHCVMCFFEVTYFMYNVTDGNLFIVQKDVRKAMYFNKEDRSLYLCDNNVFHALIRNLNLVSMSSYCM